jgi:hypothetical protein
MGPALRCNLFVFKGKTKRIFTSIRAKKRDRAFFAINAIIVFSPLTHRIIFYDYPLSGPNKK